MATLVPAAPALADGKASTRNILLGIGAATYLIIQHNRKVHERYAEDARRQAELQSENNDAWAAYHSEKNAYDNALAEVSDLKREVAYQHDQVDQLRHQVAMLTPRGVGGRPTNFVAQTTLVKPTSVGGEQQVAVTSYGWGSI